MVRAAKAARAHEFILEKEDGYDTYVGEGTSLSGGEKQRIAIAQAILHDPPILILDEATSSVDSETEKAIQEAISNLIRNRTVIAIAHRLATLRNASRLVVIEDGKIAEIGTHDELLAKDGIYARLVKIQTDLSRSCAPTSGRSDCHDKSPFRNSSLIREGDQVFLQLRRLRDENRRQARLGAARSSAQAPRSRFIGPDKQEVLCRREPRRP